MTARYSDFATKQNDPTPKQMLSRDEQTPSCGILTPTYTTVVGITTADTIYMQKVRKGTTLFATMSKLRTSAAIAASAFAVNVGWEYVDGTEDVDAFGSAININGGANEFALDEKVNFTFAQDGWITITPSTVTGAVTAGETIEGEFMCNLPL